MNINFMEGCMRKKRVSKRKIMLAVLLVLAVTAGCIIYYTVSSRAELSKNIYQQYQGKLVFYDADSRSYIYQTRHKKRTSDIYYSTVALEFSRIRTDVGDPRFDEPYASDNASMTGSDPHLYVTATASDWNKKNGQTRESFYLSANDAKQHSEEEASTGKLITTYEFSEEMILGILRDYHPEWYAELTAEMEAGNNAYIGVDCVIMIHDKGKYGDKEWSAKVQTYSDGTINVLGTAYSWATINELKSAESWSTAVPAAMDSCFNTYVPFGGEKQEEEELPPPEVTPPPASTAGSMWIVKNPFDGTTNTTSSESNDDRAAPHTFTYNYSDVFDIGDAIPTTESYTNGIEIDSWYGKAGIAQKNVSYSATVPNVSLTVTYPVTKTSYYMDDSPRDDTIDRGDETWTYQTVGSMDANGNYRIKATVTSTATQTFTMPDGYTYTYYGSYYRVSALNLYEYVQASVRNDSVGTVTYDTPSNIQYNVTINGENVNSGAGTAFSSDTFSAPEYVTTDNHVTLPAITAADLTYDETISASGAYTAEEAAAYIKNAIDTRFSAKPLVTRNDVLQLNGTTYMDENNLYVPFSPGNNHYIGAEANDKVTGETVVTIPKEQDNGIYYTTLKTTYKKFVGGNGTRTITKEDSEASKTAIKAGYEANEPVVVHSPVIAPITIGGESTVQTTGAVSSTQLLLDGTYTVEFNWVRYFAMKGYDNPAGWTKYVKDKQARFPFSVMVNGEYFEPDASGYTDWIPLGNVTSFNFYVPTWAREGVYGEESYTGYNANEKPIRVRVLANNAEGHEIMEEYEYNDSLSSYVAVYDFPVQVSGVLYGFTVTAANDEMLFGGYERSTGIYNFIQNKEERRAGIKNRFGTPDVRRTLDGAITDTWDAVNTVPFVTGSSHVFGNMGTLVPGHKIAFSLKTIGNLNGTKDTIKITPVYRFIQPDGTVLESDEFNLYYSKPATPMIGWGSETDRSYTDSIHIGSDYFKYGYGDYGSNFSPETAEYTASKYGKTLYQVMNEETASYCFSDITLYSSQKLLTGNEEELAVNIAKNASDAARYQKAGGLGYLTATEYDAFKSSMQTWYGSYQIPADLYVVKKLSEGSEYEDALDEWYAKNSYVTSDAACFEKTGWLVLSFKIETYKDGIYRELSYDAGSLDMWEREGQITGAVNLIGTTNLNNVQIRKGDIAAIDIGRSLLDRYEEGILYLN